MNRISTITVLCLLLSVGGACQQEEVEPHHLSSDPWVDDGPLKSKAGVAKMRALLAPEPEPEPDPCQGVSADGLCVGASLKQCMGAQVVVVDCVLKCNGLCINHPKNHLPACLCPSGGDPCDDVPESGQCQLDVLLRCLDGLLVGIDCGATGVKCVTESGEAGCGEPGVFNECGSVTAAGQCDGTELTYCDGGQLVTVDCAASEQICVYSEEIAIYTCSSH